MRVYGRVTRVDVFDSRVQGWYAPGGMVRAHARKIGRRVKRHAKAEAPVRRGNLRRTIRDDISRRGKYHLVAFVRAHSGHAYFVHEGTGPQRGGKRLRGSPGPKSGPHGWQPGMREEWPRYAGGKNWIAGQHANPFLTRGMAKAAAEFPGGGVLPSVLRGRTPIRPR